MRLVETIMLKGFYITFDALKHHILLKKQGIIKSEKIKMICFWSLRQKNVFINGYSSNVPDDKYKETQVSILGPLNGRKLHQSDSVKNFGIQIDKNLTWKKQISQIKSMLCDLN